MPAITIRNLPEHVHIGLRGLAATRGQSVEALVRNTLAEAVQSAATKGAKSTQAPGMSEATFPWNAPQASPQMSCELWGALKGSAYIPQGADPTAPLDEAWEAAT